MDPSTSLLVHHGLGGAPRGDLGREARASGVAVVEFVVERARGRLTKIVEAEGGRSVSNILSC